MTVHRVLLHDMPTLSQAARKNMAGHPMAICLRVDFFSIARYITASQYRKASIEKVAKARLFGRRKYVYYSGRCNDHRQPPQFARSEGDFCHVSEILRT